MKQLQLLLVEDSVDDALLLIRYLTTNGYDVTYERVDTLDGLHSALDQTSEWQFVISDYRMPRFSGMDALKIVQERQLDIPFIIISGVIGEDTAVAAMRAGAHDYIMKGNLSRLIPAIERELHEVEERKIRKWAENKVNRLSGALEQSQNLVLMTDHDNRIEYVNASFTKITGFCAEDLIGIKIDQWQIDNILSPNLATLAAAFGHNAEWSGEIKLRTKSGAINWVSGMISPIKDETGQFSGSLVVMDDITERKRLEEQLRDYTAKLENMVDERTAELSRINHQLVQEIEDRKLTQTKLERARDQALHGLRFKQQILVNMHHEVRTPLSIVNTKLYLLRQGLYGAITNEQEEALSVIDMEAYKLLNVLDNLLDMAQLEAGGIELHMDVFELSDLLDKVVKRALPLANEKQLQLTYQIEPKMIETVSGDFRRMTRMLFNLVENAIRFTEHGTIAICIYQPDTSHWAMQVCDTGPGIPDSIRSHIFEPFWQKDNSDTRMTKRGVGLGLAIVGRLVHGFDGEIRLTSNQPSGTVVDVVLPIV